MKTTNFSEIAARYERDSHIQISAAEKLLGVLDVRRDDDVLDLGCGTGSLTRKLRSLTEGTVVGVDPSEGMIREAEGKRNGSAITLAVKSAEGIDYHDSFTLIFCNSAFQWFRDPVRALKNCYTALHKGGRMGVQAPARERYCPNFLEAIESVAHDTNTAKTFATFKAPWIFLDTAEEYSSLFEQAGFSVPFSVIEQVKTLLTPGEVMTIFESGAAAGYLNQEYYSKPVDEAYAKTFREVVKGSFQRQANAQGKVKLVFNRIYLVAVK